jgi:hypothetical protein
MAGCGGAGRRPPARARHTHPARTPRRLATPSRLSRTALVAAACTAALAGPAAVAAPAPTAELPEPGTSYSLPLTTRQAVLRCTDGAEHRFDATGRINLTIGSPRTGLDGPTVRVTISSLELNGAGAFGEITVTADAEGELDLNSLSDPFPATMTITADLTLTLENDPCAASTAGPGTTQREPLVLTTKNPRSCPRPSTRSRPGAKPSASKNPST